MRGKVIFLCEEPSMKIFLDGLLPRIFPNWQAGQHFLCLKHEGKSDLDKSIARKLLAWREPDVHFVIIRDNDNAACLVLKTRLRHMCAAAGRPETLIRLVCQELESWYLGDLPALSAAFGLDVNTPKNQRLFAQPDARSKPSQDMKRLIPEFQKISGARLLASCLEPSNNASHSFRVCLAGLRRLVERIELSHTHLLDMQTILKSGK